MITYREAIIVAGSERKLCEVLQIPEKTLADKLKSKDLTEKHLDLLRRAYLFACGDYKTPWDILKVIDAKRPIHDRNMLLTRHYWSTKPKPKGMVGVYE